MAWECSIRRCLKGRRVHYHSHEDYGHVYDRNYRNYHDCHAYDGFRYQREHGDGAGKAT